MNTKIFSSREELGIAAANSVAEKILLLLHQQPEANVIFAAAPSQNEFLSALKKLPLDWHRINAFHMDEYIGLHEDAPQGFGNFLKTKLFDKIPFKNIFIINGNAANTRDECRRYADLLIQYPVDIVCMGIGENGHIAFNDPPVADFEDPATVKEVILDAPCRQQQVNDGCFKDLDEVPKKAITLTIPALMKAKYISCVVPGASKAKAVYNTLYAEKSTLYPSTVLREHPSTIVFLDDKSSQLLSK